MNTDITPPIRRCWAAGLAVAIAVAAMSTQAQVVNARDLNGAMQAFDTRVGPPREETAPPVAAACEPDADLRRGAVYTILNTRPDNQVAAYFRSNDGTLCAAGAFATGGASDIYGLIVSGQNSVIMGAGHVFVINPGAADGGGGEGSLSVFRIEQDRLVLIDVEPSGGPSPRSVTLFDDTVYVVNAGFSPRLMGTLLPPVPENVQGFRFDAATGSLDRIEGASFLTADPDGDPAQIEFTRDGRYLVISQRHTSDAPSGEPIPRYLEVINLDERRLPVSVSRHEVGGDRPFGFRMGPQDEIYLTHGQLQDASPGGISSHQVDAQGSIRTLTPFLVDGAGETCWNYISRSTNIPYQYTSAYFDAAISLSSVNADGTVTLLNPFLASSASGDGLSPGVGGLDMHGAVDASGAEYLYVLNNPIAEALGLPIVRIVGYRIDPESGGLIRLGDSVASGITNSGFGLWAE